MIHNDQLAQETLIIEKKQNDKLTLYQVVWLANDLNACRILETEWCRHFYTKVISGILHAQVKTRKYTIMYYTLVRITYMLLTNFWRDRSELNSIDQCSLTSTEKVTYIYLKVLWAGVTGRELDWPSFWIPHGLYIKGFLSLLVVEKMDCRYSQLKIL